MLRLGFGDWVYKRGACPGRAIYLGDLSGRWNARSAAAGQSHPHLHLAAVQIHAAAKR